MKKISKSDQPARLSDEEQERRDAIQERLSDPRRGHHAEGSKWWRIVKDDSSRGWHREALTLHWNGDTYDLIRDEDS